MKQGIHPFKNTLKFISTACGAIKWVMLGAFVFLGAAVTVAEPLDSDTCFGLTPAHARTTYACVDGIPLLRFTAPNLSEGKSQEFKLGGITANRLFLFGMLNSPDATHPAWGGGDSFRNFFIGDSAGSIVLTYTSGRHDEIPLVFGYTMMWRNNYHISPAPFSTDPAARARLDAALCILNGLDAFKNNDPLCLCVIPRPEPLVSLTLIDNPNKMGYPVLNALTLTTRADGAQTNSLLKVISGLTLNQDTSAWLKSHSVEADNPFPANRKRALKYLQEWLYVTTNDITFRKVRQAAKTIQTTTNDLPVIRFRGPVEAEIMTDVYRENSAELLTRIKPDGMVQESNPTADNYNGFGTYTPAMGPFKDDYYTRNWAPALLDNLGCFSQASAALAFFDHWLMYFPQSYPALQMGGQPVPGHATVICNKPHVYFDSLRNHGWPTKFTTRDMGNPETDGHGFMMLNHYNAWVKTGRSPAWVNEHWPALQAAAEFIPWQLDNPKLSFSDHGLLYAESEGGMETESFYCNVPCWLGLLAFADMAESAGHPQQAERWRAYATKLQAATNNYFLKTVEPWGDVWDPDKTAHWGYPITALAPALFGLDYWGLDLRGHMPEGWAGRSDRTWKLAVAGMKPPWCASSGFGYGQAYYAIAGLLLDQTADTGNIVDWMARMIFAPGQAHSFRVPEGVVITSDTSMWRRWGDLGNLFQMGAVLRAIQVMIGFDDLSPDELKIMPRIPTDWDGVEVKNQSVRTLSDGHSQIVRLQLNYSRDHTGRNFKVILNPDLPIDCLSLRLGPVASGAFNASVDGHPLKIQARNEGDARWIWLTLLKLPAGEHTIVLKN